MKTAFLKSDLETTKRTIEQIKEYLGGKENMGLIGLAFDKTIEAVDLILATSKDKNL